jgi:hypothetical protein
VQQIFLISKTSNPPLAPTQPRIYWMPGVYPWVEQPALEISHLQLLPSLEIGVDKENLTLNNGSNKQ